MKQMMLHEAIRLGAMSCPQEEGPWLDNGRACALGAAQLAVGIPADTRQCSRATVNTKALEEYWPILGRITQSPVNGQDYTIGNMIWILNDRHGWTRERIADWLQPIEESFMASQPTVVASTPQAEPVMATVNV